MSETRPARLFTAFGTVVYVDGASGEVRHGPIDGSPANAFLEAQTTPLKGRRRGLLTHDAGEARAPISIFADRRLSALGASGLDGSIPPTPLEIIPLERGLIALAAGGTFLSAVPEGWLRASASACSTWEIFLASEDWCTDSPDFHHPGNGAQTFDQRRIASFIVHPTVRAGARRRPKARKILIFGYTKWSHGRVYYDLCKHLHNRGYVVDVLDWQGNHADYVGDLAAYYDLFMTALDGVRPLVDSYRIPHERIIVISHSEMDIRMLIEEKGREVFEKFANYGVVSDFVYSASMMHGVPRTPMVASVGVNYSEFVTGISQSLQTVGYASSMSNITYGVEWKRGHLAEAAARDAGLLFRIAGSTANQTSFHDMPEFYRQVDAVVSSSLSEAAGLPVIEAAAAGRLVIGTPVGHFPLKAYQGGGVIAPIEAEKFKTFVAATLRYYVNNPAAYVDKCGSIQEAAQRFDWRHYIDEWVELIEAARS